MSRLVRLATTAEHLPLADLWRRSVEATHHFLSVKDIDTLYPEVRDIYLPAAALWVVVESGVIRGFIGLGGSTVYTDTSYRKVEMLFVDPPARATGIGSALLDFASHRYGRLCVDVNEQNPEARGFYEAKGFVARVRSALDGQGRPFPLLHMYRK